MTNKLPFKSPTDNLTSFLNISAKTNKVVFNNQTLIDLSEDTVKASDVREGVIFHLPNGKKAVGTLKV